MQSLQEHPALDEAEPEPIDDGVIPPIIRTAVFVGAGLVALQTLYLLFVAYTGISLSRTETQVSANALQKIGAAFSGHVNIPTGVTLLVAVALLSAPAAAKDYRSSFTTTRTAALLVVSVLGLIITVGTILGVRSTVYFLPPLTHHLSSSQRWELVAYVTGTAGTALLATGAALACLPRVGSR